MTSSHYQKIREHPQSRGNTALVDESLSAPLRPLTKTCQPQLRMVKTGLQDVLENDALAPFTGIVNGIRLSLTLWSLIALTILLI